MGRSIYSRYLFWPTLVISHYWQPECKWTENDINSYNCMWVMTENYLHYQSFIHSIILNITGEKHCVADMPLHFLCRGWMKRWRWMEARNAANRSEQARTNPQTAVGETYTGSSTQFSSSVFSRSPSPFDVRENPFHKRQQGYVFRAGADVCV